MKRNVLVLMISSMLVAGIVLAEEAKAPAKPEAAKTDAAQTNAPAVAGPSPKIQFDKTVYDFGNTSMVSQLTGTFTYHNTGEGVLELKKPTTSCGCTVASVTTNSLKTGEKGELVFTMNVGSMTKGHAEKKITVPSNDPQTPSVQLTVKAEIIPTFDYNPQAISLGDVRQGKVTNVTVQVKRLDGKKLALTKAEPSNKSIRARIEPGTDAEGTTAQLLIEAEAEGSPRRFNDNVKVYADNNTNQPAFTIQINGRLVGDLTLNPEAVFWGIADPEHWPGARPELQNTRNIRIQATDATTPLEIRNVSSSLKDVSVSLNTIETGKVYEVVAKLAEAPKDSEHGTITFETTLASQKTVNVPVTINVLKR